MYLEVRSLISRVVDAQTLTQLDKHESDLLVVTNPLATFCPGTGCDRVAFFDAGGSRGARSVQRCDLFASAYTRLLDLCLHTTMVDFACSCALGVEPLPRNYWTVAVFVFQPFVFQPRDLGCCMQLKSLSSAVLSS